MTRILAATMIAAATLATTNAHAYIYDSYFEPIDADVPMSEWDYDYNLAAVASADGIAPGHVSLQYSKSSGGNPIARGCYPAWVWNPYTGQWSYGITPGPTVAVTGGNLTAYLQGVLGAYNAAQGIFARIGRGGFAFPC